MKKSESSQSAKKTWSFPLPDIRIAAPFLVCLGISTLLLLVLGSGALAARGAFASLVPGQVAEKDIKATQDVVYVDKEATRLRIEAEERLVLPVFQLDEKASQRALAQFADFAERFRSLAEENIAQETAILMLESRFPGQVPHATLLALASSSLKPQILVYSQDVLRRMLDKGIFSLPGEGLSRYNPDYFELRRRVSEKTSMEQRSRASMVTKSNLPEALAAELSGMHLAKPLTAIIQSLVVGFAVENAFFDDTYSAARLKKVAASVEPVSRRVSKNEVILRAGQLVSEDDYQRILTIRKAMSTADIGLSFRGLGLLASAAALALLLLARSGPSPIAEDRSLYLLGIYGSLAFYVIALISARSGTGSGSIQGAYFL
ncbi:MAG TPA: hypothetical protein VIO60_00855, partial [Rectinemataceae bacterium]